MRTRRRPPPEDIVEPTAERERHGPIERAEAAIEDVEGGSGRPFRALSSLDIMLRAGSITREAHRAGGAFHQDFVLAGFEPIAAADPTRVPVLVNSARWTRGPPGSEQARKRVLAALDALGGHEALAASCAFHVLGRELSIRQWAIHRGWGRRRPVSSSSGILIVTLDLLRIHYDRAGYARRG